MRCTFWWDVMPSPVDVFGNMYLKCCKLQFKALVIPCTCWRSCDSIQIHREWFVYAVCCIWMYVILATSNLWRNWPTQMQLWYMFGLCKTWEGNLNETIVHSGWDVYIYAFAHGHFWEMYICDCIPMNDLWSCMYVILTTSKLWTNWPTQISLQLWYKSGLCKTWEGNV